MRRNVRACLVLFLSAALSLGLLEAFLRAAPSCLPMNLRNALLNKYNDRADGIYFQNNEFRTHCMKPSFGQHMFFCGYRWRHRSNSAGIRRSEELDRADVVLLGDSMVYGHGLEENQTSASLFERLTGTVVANAAVQADYPVKEYIRLKWGPALYFKPKLVVWCIQIRQDIDGFENNRPNPEWVESLVRRAPPDYSGAPAGAPLVAGYTPPRLAWQPPLVFRTISVLRRARKAQRNASAYDLAAMERIMNTILPDADQLCRSAGARLAVVFLPCIQGKVSNDPLSEQTRRICMKEKIPLLDLSLQPFRFERYLPGDGHFSETGNRWFVAELARFIDEKGLLREGSASAAGFVVEAV